MGRGKLQEDHVDMVKNIIHNSVDVVTWFVTTVTNTHNLLTIKQAEENGNHTTRDQLIKQLTTRKGFAKDKTDKDATHLMCKPQEEAVVWEQNAVLSLAICVETQIAVSIVLRCKVESILKTLLI